MLFQKGHKLNLGKKRAPFSDEWKRKIGLANKGKKLSEETKNKMSKVAKEKGFGKWSKGRQHSEESKKKMSEAKKGWKMSEKSKHKLSISKMGQNSGSKSHLWKGGKIKSSCKECGKEFYHKKSRKGIFCSRSCKWKNNEWRKNQFKDVKRDNFGEKNHNWRGGKSFEPYPLNWNETLKRSIRERDHYSCRICLKQQESYAFHVHHIDYNKNNCNPNNLITLCKSCHTKTNFNREKWKEYFNFYETAV